MKEAEEDEAENEEEEEGASLSVELGRIVVLANITFVYTVNLIATMASHFLPCGLEWHHSISAKAGIAAAAGRGE